MKSYAYLFVLLLLSLIPSSCKENMKQTNDLTVPELLNRRSAVQQGTEWAEVQTRYQNFSLGLQSNPNKAVLALALAELFTVEARVTGEHGHYYPAALQMTNHALSVDTLEEDLIFLAKTMKAGILLSQHAFTEALPVAKEAFAMRPHNAQILGVLVDNYVELGDYQAAIAMADQMIKVRPDLRSYARVSYLREIHGDIPGAQEAMQLAIKAGMPGSEERAWAALQLAELNLRYQNTQEAEAILKSILAERTDYPFAEGSLAAVYIKQGNYDAAERLLTKAIQAIPEVGFYISLAEIQKRKGHTEDFQHTINEVLKMLAEDVETGHVMDLEYANLHLNVLDNPQQALHYISKAYQRRPDNIDVNRELALIHAKLGNTQEANFHLAKATRTKSKHPDLSTLVSL